jgi:hypothetical protein
MKRAEILETTLGDLIVALTEEASRHARDAAETYTLVAYILSDLLNNSHSEPRRWQ